jgi:hypothetical protein
MSYGDLLYLGGMDDFFKHQGRYPFYEKIEITEDIKLKNIFFRHKCLSLMETIGVGEKNKHLASPEEISIITYRPGRKFSSDVINIIKRMSSDNCVNLAFNYSVNKEFEYKDEVRIGLKKAKIDDLILAFKGIFETNPHLTLNVIASNSVHIKGLQVDDHFYTGSMNFSSTADSVAEYNKSGDDSFFNHELILHFGSGGKHLAGEILKKIGETEGAVKFTMTGKNYQKLLYEKILPLRKVTNLIADDKEIAKKMKALRDNIGNTNRLIRLSINSYLNEGFISFFRHEFHIFSESYFYYQDAETVFNFFNEEGAAEKFINFQIEINLHNIMPLHSGREDEDEDEDEDEKSYDDVKESLIYITQEKIDEHLSSLIMNESEIKKNIFKEYQGSFYDDGESPGDSWEIHSDNESEVEMEKNRVVVFTFIECLIEELCDFLCKENNYKKSFFSK